MESNIFAEIGHFYTNKPYCLSDLNYLKRFNFKDARPVIFMDDYSYPTPFNEFNSIIIKSEAEKIIKKPVEIFYESQMIEFVNEGINDLGAIYRNGGYFWKECRLTSAMQPTCLFLSYLWTRFRLKQAKRVWTIIELKYKRLEQTVLDMLPPMDRQKCFYDFI